MHYSAVMPRRALSARTLPRNADARASVLTRLAGRVRRLRESHGWSRAELSARSGLSVRFLARIESGRELDRDCLAAHRVQGHWPDAVFEIRPGTIAVQQPDLLDAETATVERQRPGGWHAGRGLVGALDVQDRMPAQLLAHEVHVEVEVEVLHRHPVAVRVGEIVARRIVVRVRERHRRGLGVSCLSLVWRRCRNRGLVRTASGQEQRQHGGSEAGGPGFIGIHVPHGNGWPDLRHGNRQPGHQPV